ncbi:DNA cytosine methyltransferase [Streptomyces sp. NPDC058953]|uniref:DNA cytosine methyltransferase n=1 Tax=unclassified Streptomyces TaxID=2593676 RepID=UPI0036C3A2C8
MGRLTSVEVCAGGGGLALGLERAGFDPVLLLDDRDVACETLRLNRPAWNVLEMDLVDFDPVDHPISYDVDLLSAGLPRVKSSATVNRAETGKEADLLKVTIQLASAVQSRAVLIENVPELVEKPQYAEVREYVRAELEHLGYRLNWFVLDAADYGVPQRRKQGILIALKNPYADAFEPPVPTVDDHITVGEALRESMGERGWTGLEQWVAGAVHVAPTLVGGSYGRGGGDLGPRGSKRAWERMGINGGALGDEVPGPDGAQESDKSGSPHKKLTVPQAALLQAFPPEWSFAGGKTNRYRQIGQASPPLVAEALGRAVAAALKS